MLLGFASKIRLRATALLEGWLNATLPPAPMLKEDQLSVAALLVCVIARELPDATAVAAYKKRLIDYLDRFFGDLVSRSGNHPPGVR